MTNSVAHGSGLNRRQGADQIIRLGGLGLFATLLPLLTIHVTYVVAAWEGYVEWCVPYWDACTSISATGRHGLGYFIFKGVMTPAVVLLALLWVINHRWLQSLGHAWGRGVGWLGVTAGVFLLVYVVSLGHVGNAFEVARRVGTIGYVGLTGIAQILLAGALWQSAHPLLARGGRRLLQLSAVTLIVGVLSLVLQSMPAVDYDAINYAFDWIIIVLLNVHGVAMAWLWHRAGLAVTLPRTLNAEDLVDRARSAPRSGH